MNKTSAVILILLAIGIYYSFTLPQYQKLAVLTAQAAEYRNAINNASRIAETRDSLASSAQSISAAEKDRLAKVLPDNIDAVGLARELDTIGSQYGITLKSLALQETVDPQAKLIVLPEGNKPYERAVVSFSVISNYPNFVKFLSDIEKSLRVMDARSASFTVGESGLYEHTITVDTYWLKK